MGLKQSPDKKIIRDKLSERIQQRDASVKMELIQTLEAAEELLSQRLVQESYKVRNLAESPRQSLEEGYEQIHSELVDVWEVLAGLQAHIDRFRTLEIADSADIHWLDITHITTDEIAEEADRLLTLAEEFYDYRRLEQLEAMHQQLFVLAEMTGIGPRQLEILRARKRDKDGGHDKLVVLYKDNH